MPVRVNEFIIQAKFEDEEPDSASATSLKEEDLLIIKEEIISACMEKVEILLQKKEGR